MDRGKRNTAPKKALPSKETADSFADSDSTASNAEDNEELIVDLHRLEDVESTPSTVEPHRHPRAKAKAPARPDIDAFDDVKSTPPTSTSKRQAIGTTGTPTDTPPPPPPGVTGKSQATGTTGHGHGKTHATPTGTPFRASIETPRRRGRPKKSLTSNLGNILKIGGLKVHEVEKPPKLERMKRQYCTSSGFTTRGSDTKCIANLLVAGIECDTAPLTVYDDNLKLIQFGALLASGVVSRIDMLSYHHELMQVDACESTGGPVLNRQSLKSDATDDRSYVIPVPVVQHFLRDFESTGYRAMGLELDQKGGELIDFSYLISQKNVEETVPVEVLHENKTLVFSCNLPIFISKSGRYYAPVTLLDKLKYGELVIDIVKGLDHKILGHNDDPSSSKSSKINGEVCDDVLATTFSLLPTKQLFQLKSLSKVWAYNIENDPLFKEFKVPPFHILAFCPRGVEEINSVGYLSLHSQDDLSGIPDRNVIWLPDYLHNFNRTEICGPIKGIVCISDRTNVCLLNPTTGISWMIPRSEFQDNPHWQRESIGFGFNNNTEDFTIITFSTAVVSHNMESRIHLFSFKQQVWNDVIIEPLDNVAFQYPRWLGSGSSGTISGNKYFWPIRIEADSDHIMEYDFTSSVLTYWPIPIDLRGGNVDMIPSVRNWGDDIALVMSDYTRTRIAMIRMDNHGVEIQPVFDHLLVNHPGTFLRPINIWDDKGVILIQHPGLRLETVNFNGVSIPNEFDILNCKQTMLYRESDTNLEDYR